MNVSYISNVEAEKESFYTKDPYSIGFGEWLALEI